MSKKLYTLIGILIASLLLVSFLIGYTISNNSNGQNNQTIEEQPILGNAMHAHEQYNIPEGAAKPEITELIIMKDAKVGWNLEIKTKNFTFTPENVNEEIIDGQGHAHLYIDNQKITRLYSPYYYIADYTEGVHEVKVTLNTNDHKDYAIDGKTIEANTKIVGEHEHDSEPEGHSH